MSAKRFTEWQLYELVEPFGERAQYWRTGQICAAIANSRRTRNNDPIAKAEDFMPKTFRANQEQESSTDDFDQIRAQYEGGKGAGW